MGRTKIEGKSYKLQNPPCKPLFLRGFSNPTVEWEPTMTAPPFKPDSERWFVGGKFVGAFCVQMKLSHH